MEMRKPKCNSIQFILQDIVHCFVKFWRRLTGLCPHNARSSRIRFHYVISRGALDLTLDYISDGPIIRQ